MIEPFEYVSLLISAASLCILISAKRKEARLTQKLESVAEQCRSIAAQLEIRTSAAARPVETTRFRHDLLTPLNTVIGFCALLKQVSVGLPPGQARMIENIEAASNEVLELVDAASDVNSQGRRRHA